MARSLVLVPPGHVVLVGSIPIGPGYPRPYTPQEMDAWAQDLGRLYRTVEEDRGLAPDERRLGAWLATPRAQLAPQAQRVVDVHRRLLAEPDTAIKGCLRSDGRVELDAGRHRAHYVAARGEPVPVWVSSPDANRLAGFRAACHRSVDQQRPGLLNPDRTDPQRTEDPAMGRPVAERAGPLAVRAAAERSELPVGCAEQVPVRTANRDRAAGELGRNALAAEAARTRADAAALGRLALEGELADRARGPDYHLAGERLEATRERSPSGRERL